MFPIFAIYDLSIKKKQILNNILEFNKFKVFDNFSLFYLHSNDTKKAFLNLDWNQILTLNSFDYPLIILTDKKNYKESFLNSCIEENLIPIYFLGNPAHWNLPFFSIQKKKNLIIFFNPIKFKKIYKTLFEFNGYKTITLPSMDSLIFFLKEQQNYRNQIFLILDLDNQRNFMKLFIEINKLVKSNFLFLKYLNLIVLKDLKEDILYPSILALKQFLQQHQHEFPPICKIFDYHYFIFLLLECLFFPYQKKFKSFVFYSLKDFLYNKEIQDNMNLKKLYKLYLNQTLPYWIASKKILPFLWLYQTSLYKENQGELLLG